MPSVGGGMGVNVAGPSADVDVRLPSDSGGLPGTCKAPGLRCLLSLTDIVYARLVFETTASFALSTRVCTRPSCIDLLTAYVRLLSTDRW